jgi:hypothetical protein
LQNDDAASTGTVEVDVPELILMLWKDAKPDGNSLVNFENLQKSIKKFSDKDDLVGSDEDFANFEFVLAECAGKSSGSKLSFGE